MTPDERREAIEAWLLKAEEGLADAAILLDRASRGGAMNRCYYAMFSAACALVVRDGLALHKHRAVISHVQREYVRTGRIPEESGRALLTAFDRRTEADYHAMVRFSVEDTSKTLEQARRFVAEVRALVAKA
ncbi:MAG: HEPN domain-containing protein [Thermoguttaceae bacterium]|jgi:uncharacterized protein (UPF0332 family)